MMLSIVDDVLNIDMNMPMTAPPSPPPPPQPTTPPAQIRLSPIDKKACIFSNIYQLMQTLMPEVPLRDLQKRD